MARRCCIHLSLFLNVGRHLTIEKASQRVCWSLLGNSYCMRLPLSVCVATPSMCELLFTDHLVCNFFRSSGVVRALVILSSSHLIVRTRSQYASLKRSKYLAIGWQHDYALAFLLMRASCLMKGLCEKRAEAFIDYRTVHKVLRRAAEGGFPYLKRRCLEFCLMHLSEVS